MRFDSGVPVNQNPAGTSRFDAPLCSAAVPIVLASSQIATKLANSHRRPKAL